MVLRNMNNASFGISVGSSYSCVAASKGERNSATGRVDADVIASDAGDRTTPSVVHFPNAGQSHVVGLAAKNSATRTPQSVVSGSKLILGHTFDHPTVQNYIKKSAVKVVEKDNLPFFEIERDGKLEYVSPADVTGKVYTKMREIADTYIGTAVKEAVITVPLDFDDERREAVKKAASQAGIHILRVLSEPIAAAIAYGFDLQRDVPKKLVVFDLGSRSLDVTVLLVSNGVFQVLAHVKNDRLGGEAFDEILVKHFAQEFGKKNRVDIMDNKKALAKLRASIETVKHTLSSSNTAICSVESLYEGIDLNGSVNRGRFEILSSDLFKQCMDVVQSAMTSCQLTSADIDSVILAGGGSRIPKLKSLLTDLFEGREPLSSIMPEEVFAVGSAVQASLLFDTEQADETGAVKHAPALSTDIVVCGANSAHLVLLPKLTPLPARIQRKLTTSEASAVVTLAERTSADATSAVAKLVLRKVVNSSVTLDVDIGTDGELRASLSSGAADNRVSVSVPRKP